MTPRPRHLAIAAAVALSVALAACAPPTPPPGPTTTTSTSSTTSTTTTTSTTVPATPVFTFTRTNETATFTAFGPFGPFLWGTRSAQFRASSIPGFSGTVTSDITGTVTPACTGVPTEAGYNPTATVGIYPIHSGVGPIVGTLFTGPCGSPISVSLPAQSWGPLDSIEVAIQQAGCGTAACTSLTQKLSINLRGDGTGGTAIGAI